MKPALLLISIAIIFAACGDRNDYTVSADTKYEKSKESLEKTEQNNPTAFLTVSVGEKKNLIGQTVVKAELTNKAKIVTYKDVDIRLSFYSKTGAVLEQDDDTIYEVVAPGRSKKVKSKYFTPRGTDSVGIVVLKAKTL